ncbi:TetR/AcrR family transcriptional regulator [Amycolatopsis dendrobii]|uniref:TetR/AcrR family transcriptional regulator n=1 Tax=Amycolatopsis dendrobii TaxID=2760662 RepID=A0A7W3ZFS7_9PSEU|nr:TetR/AcrR family transcriptional regulator [Amycolatopsis dendrobii]MBB1159344.1 TetR/AcrR family transcriptional regulator [Amycolatopsis dendrobii]
MARRYHHGDLRQAVLTAAVEVLGESGPAAVNLRDLARRVGVSHAAPAHHFGDRAGLLTAVAAQGFDLLADALEELPPSPDLLEAGVAYVSFAVEHRAHFEVMFRADLLRGDDPDLRAARERGRQALDWAVAGFRDGSADPVVAGAAAWSLMHGFATLWLQRALPADLGDDVRTAARSVSELLVRGAHQPPPSG